MSIREIFYEQFTELRTVMQSSFSTPLTFIEDHKIESSGIFCSRIMSENKELNFFHDEDVEPALQFFKTQLMSLDEFWTEFKDIFIALQS